MNKIIDALGWYGMAAIVGAYACASFALLSVDNVWYQLLNGTGAIGIVAVSFYKRAYQPAFLNCLWAVIAFVAIARTVLR